MKVRQCLFLLLFSLRFMVSAQGETKNESISTPLVGIHWGGNLPGGDLLARYGYLNNLGFSAGYKLESQWYFGVDANFIFGNQVKMNGIFDHLLDDKGNITDVNGTKATVLVFPRGFNANFSVGRLFPTGKKNANSGITRTDFPIRFAKAWRISFLCSLIASNCAFGLGNKKLR